MAVKKSTAKQTTTTRKTTVRKSTVTKPAAATTAAKKSTAKKSVKTVTKDKPTDYRIGELDQYLFGQGTHYEIYKKMGAHFVKNRKKPGVYFAVWAPHAKAVSVIGEFNDWNEDANVMERQEPLGIYTAFVPEAQLGQLYKYCITAQTGDKLYKADPFANSAELRPGTASRIADISHLKWSDSTWMKHRAEWDFHSSPISAWKPIAGRHFPHSVMSCGPCNPSITTCQPLPAVKKLPALLLHMLWLLILPDSPVFKALWKMMGLSTQPIM